MDVAVLKDNDKHKEKRLFRQNCFIKYLLVLVLGFIYSNGVLANVAVTGVQAPTGEILAGTTVSYTLSVTNTPTPPSQPANVFVQISVNNATPATGLFTANAPCTGPDAQGVYACGVIANGASGDFVFSWQPPLGSNGEAVTHDVFFSVTCSESGLEICTGGGVRFTTSVRPFQAGVLQFSASTYQASEGDAAVIRIDRTGGSDGTLVADVTIGGGSTDTVSTADYNPPGNTTLTFAPDVISQTITIPIIADTLVEGDETLSLALVGSTGVVGTPSTAVLTIIDTNSAGTLGYSSDTFTASEQNGEAVISVARTGGMDGELTATVEITDDTATRDEDYQVPADLLLTWGNGDGAPKEIKIPVLADNKIEADEKVNLLLKDSAGQTISTASLTITDNPPVADKVVVVSGGQQKGEAGTTLDPFIIKVLDQAGNAIEGAPVTWTITPATGGSLGGGAETASDAQGESSNVLTINTSNRVIVTAKAAEGENQTATFIVNRALIDTPQLTENQRRVAAALDSACAALTAKQQSGAALTAGEADLLATCNKLAAASDADIAEGLNRLAPDEIASQGTASIKAANLQVTNINSRLNALRSGVKGMSLSGLNLNVQGENIPGAVLSAMLNGQARGGSAGDEIGGRSPWGGFINGEISFGDKDDTGREPGFDFDTTGITAGIDYRISNEVVVGGAIGYGSTESDFNDGVSNMEMDGYHLTGYGTYYRTDNFYMDGLIKLGWNNYDTSRRINFPGDPLQKAEGDTDSFEYSFSFTGGYEVNRDALTLGGYGRIGYTKVEIDGYSESASNPGVPGFGSVLRLADQDVDSLTTTLGGEISYAISTSKAVFMPQLRLEWEHEFNDDERAIDAQFIHDPSSTTFGVLTDEADTDYFNVGLGFSVITRGGKSGFLYYETRIDQDNIEQHWIKGGIRFEY